jgi:hypothetical protein
MATLYATADQTRFFHVPDDASLPPGDLVVRSLTGKKISADPVALDVYEVPEAEAMRLAQEVLGGFAEKLRAVTMSAAAALAKPARLDPEAVAAREERVAGYLKLGREQLRGDPAALGAALKGAMQDIVNAAQETVHAPEVAEERMRDVAEALRQEGAPAGTPEMLEGLPDRLRALLASDDVLAKVESAAADLRAAAAELRADNAKKMDN